MRGRPSLLLNGIARKEQSMTGPEDCKQVETLLIQGCNAVWGLLSRRVPPPNLLGRPRWPRAPNCHQQLSADIKLRTGSSTKDHELVTVRGAYVLSRIPFRRRPGLARPNIWRLRALTRQISVQTERVFIPRNGPPELPAHVGVCLNHSVQRSGGRESPDPGR
jgi:hypothetical protein